MKKSEVTWCRNFYWDNGSFELHQQWAGSLVDMSLSSHYWSPSLIPQRCQFLQSNEQSLHVRAVRIIFMTASRHGDNQICSISQVSFLSESPTPNGLPKHLDIMVYKAIGLRVDVYQYHLSLHSKLEQMDEVIHRFIGAFYWLYLFIGFIYSIWWLYSLDLSIGFIYSIWWLYLFALSMGFSFSVYSIHPHSKLSFSHISERNTFTFLSIYISHVLMEKIFRFPLRHHSGLIKLTLLQLHHHTLLIKLTNTTSLHHIPYTFQ